MIEVKPGNQEACTALIRLFRKHPELIKRVAVVVSFDVYTMHRLKSGLNELASSLEAALSSSANNSCSDPVPRRSDSPDNVRSFEDDGCRTSYTLPKLPKVLLLTVAGKPTQHYHLSVSVADYAPVHHWLMQEDKPSLDDMYVKFQPEMLQPEGVASLRALTDH